MLLAQSHVVAGVVVRSVAAIAISVATASATAGLAPSAARIDIGAGDCDAGVHLVARNAPLTDVLKRLAEALNFELRLAGASDSIVDVDVSRPAPELLAKLSPQDNLIVTQGRDPRCPGLYRVVKVWMLPKAGVSLPPTVSRVSAPRQLTDAEKRQIKDGDDAYRRMHGMPPMPPQDDASK
jgi:hypothetical protein